jgi:hypothetical protein
MIVMRGGESYYSMFWIFFHQSNSNEKDSMASPDSELIHSGPIQHHARVKGEEGQHWTGGARSKVGEVR